MDSIAQITGDITAFLHEHRQWAGPVVLLLSIGESLALVSLLVPATAIMLAVGALIGSGGLEFWPCWIGAVLGAFIGDWVSYAIGRHFKDRVAHVWPLSRHPEMLARAHEFMARWGVWGVFGGRFLGPLRATVPLAAGICEMDRRRFQLVNALSALVWATAMLLPGTLGARWALDALS